MQRRERGREEEGAGVGKVGAGVKHAVNKVGTSKVRRGVRQGPLVNWLAFRKPSWPVFEAARRLG